MRDWQLRAASSAAVELAVRASAAGSRGTIDLARHHVGRQLPCERAVEQRVRVESAVAGGARRRATIALAERRVVDAERHGVAHQAGGVGGLLDLGRADAVARRLDHLVGAADEVEEARPRRATTVSPDHTAISGVHSPPSRPGRGLKRSAVRSGSFQ